MIARAGQYGAHVPHWLQRSRRITNPFSDSEIADVGHIASQTPQFMQSALMTYRISHLFVEDRPATPARTVDAGRSPADLNLADARIIGHWLIYPLSAAKRHGPISPNREGGRWLRPPAACTGRQSSNLRAA